MNSDKLEITSLDELDEYLKSKDNSQNALYISNVPNACKEFPCVLGIDEAGRGPVLGPMVYGTAFCPINKADVLASLNCADSKVLTEVKRDEIFKNIFKENKSVGWAVEVISANFICNNMLSRSKHSLNQVSMDSAIGLIKAAILGGVNIAHIYVDTVGKPETYQDYLKSLFPSYEITVAKKADSTYPIVSAASICAKVTRDHALQVWKFEEDMDLELPVQFGSGYPADPVTKEFLVDHCDQVFGYPQLVRFSWSTSVNALENKSFHIDWEELEDESTAASKNTSITSFFKMTKQKSIEKIRHQFFKQRHLKTTTEIN